MTIIEAELIFISIKDKKKNDPKTGLNCCHKNL